MEKIRVSREKGQGRLGSDTPYYTYLMRTQERNLDDYIAGFVDGEGCFALSVRRDIRHERKSLATYFSWKAMFVIVLREDDIDILRFIQKRFSCGSVTANNRRAARYRVSSLDDLHEKIIPFFIDHPMLGKKRKDFELWKRAIEILLSRKVKKKEQNVIVGKRGFQTIPWLSSEIAELNAIHESMRKFKSISAVNKLWLDNSLGREKSVLSDDEAEGIDRFVA